MSEAAFSERRALHAPVDGQSDCDRGQLWWILACEFNRRWPPPLFNPKDPETFHRARRIRRDSCDIAVGYCIDAPSLIPAGSTVADAREDEDDGDDGFFPAVAPSFLRRD